MQKLFKLLCARFVRCVLPIIADVQREFDAARFLFSEEFQRRQVEETLKGEWHRSRDNEIKLQQLLSAAFGNAYIYAVAHHLVIVQPNKPPYEIASAETLFFDRLFLSALSGESHLPWERAYKAQQTARVISTMDQQERLDYLFGYSLPSGVHICPTDLTV